MGNRIVACGLAMLAALMVTAFAGEVRTWTRLDGRTLEASLTGTAKMGGTTYVMLKQAEDTTIHKVALSQLSQADRDYVTHGGSIGGPAVNLRENAPAPAPPKLNAPAGSGPTGTAPFARHLKQDLVRYDGSRLARATIAGDPKYYAFYFSAHWCPPCRKFTPELVAFYNSMQRQTDDFEVIFVSSDRSEKEMADYMRGAGMRFFALDYGKRGDARAITRYAGRGIPCLVVVDRNGKVVADSYRGSQYLGPYQALEKLASLLRKG